MNIHDAQYYKNAQQKVEEYGDFLFQLDNVAEILYDNLEYPEIWDLIENLEEIRVKYYVLFHEYNQVVKNKGKINV